VDTQVGPLEDAALVRPHGGAPLAFTVDFITPVVDVPEDFGAIAAANALSDVYAMGGDPQVALAVCGFPEGVVPLEILARIFQGAREACAEAGCAIVGGHTVSDPELKYGLCVLGSVDAPASFAHPNARAGDRLVLTKPLGLGLAAQALRQERLEPAQVARITALMRSLNRAAKDAARAHGVRAATDVTGFGLLGHLHHLLLGAGLSARVHAARVPVLDFAEALAAEGRAPGGSRRNLGYAEGFARWDAGVTDARRLLLADAQTSGGLLLAVPPAHEAALVAALERAGVPAAAVIGELAAGDAGRIDVRSG
jgi:selenide,water dikinase